MPRREIACALLAAASALACGRSAGGIDCSPAAPGAAWLGFTSNRTGNYDLYLVHTDGSCLQPLTTDPAADLFPAWTPAGGVGFSSTRASGAGVYVHDLATGQETGIPVVGAVATAPDWSPDGRWLAFEAKAQGASRTDVYTVLASGGGAVALTSGPGNSGGPRWSTDGATIYFVSNRTGPYQLYSMAASGAGQVALAGTSGVLGRPSVSPDGHSIAYARLGAGGVAEVVVRDLGSGAERVVSGQGDGDPAFDPTGRRLAVSSTRAGNPAIWMVDAADGGHPVQVTSPAGAAIDGQPAFPRR